MRVLVTGGLGFVGRVVGLELLSAGHDVDLLTRGRDGGGSRPGTGQVVEGDIRDREQLRRIVELGRYGGVCHLAGLTRNRQSFTDAAGYWDVNLGGTLNLVAALLAASGQEGGCEPRIVFASTSVVYGSQYEGALSEDMPVRPESPYAFSKAAAEQLLRDCSAAGHITASVLRMFNVSGSVDGVADTDPTRLVPNVMRVAGGERPHLDVNGDGTAVREYTHVADVARAFRLALEDGSPGCTTFNVGTGRGVTVTDLITSAEAVTGRRIPVVRRPVQPEPRILVADPTEIDQALGWRPQRSTPAEILESTWRAWQAPSGVG